MLELLRKRRSIRAYEDRDVEPDIIEKLKEAAMRSPSSRGINSWRFVFITDRSKLEELSKAKQSGSSFLKGARLGVVVCAEGSESDVWIEDCSIASIILQLTGQSLGLGSCWIQIRNRAHDGGQSAEDYIKERLDLPESFRVESMISFGYPGEEKRPVPADQLEYDKIINK